MIKEIKKTFKKLNKKGVSLVEAVVAIAIISAVSASAISVTMYSNSVYNDSLDRFDARVKADNALASFQFSDNKTELKESLKVAGFSLDDNNDYIADAYYFDDIKISRDNLNIEFRDRSDHTIITVPDYTSAEITALESRLENDKINFELQEELYISTKNSSAKVKVNYENATVMFYENASTGWKYYHDGNFYNIDVIKSYQSEADAAGNDAGGNEDGTLEERKKYITAFNNVVSDARDQLFSKQYKTYAFKTSNKSYTSYKYLLSPYLQSIESNKLSGNVRSLDFCDAEGRPIISKEYNLSDETQNTSYLNYIQTLNKAGYKEYSTNSYKFKASYDTRALSFGLYFYRDCVVQFNNRGFNSTIKAGNYYYVTSSSSSSFGGGGSYGGNNYEWSSFTFNNTLSSSQYSTAANNVKWSDSNKYTVTVDYKARTIYFTKSSIKYYYQGNIDNSWTKTEKVFTSEEELQTAINSIKCSTTEYYDEKSSGELFNNDPISLKVDYKKNKISLTDAVGLFSNETVITNEDLQKEDVTNLEEYIKKAELKDVASFSIIGTESALSYPTGRTVKEFDREEETRYQYEDVYIYIADKNNSYAIKTVSNGANSRIYAVDANGAIKYSIKATVDESCFGGTTTTYEWKAGTNNLTAEQYNEALSDDEYTNQRRTVTVDIKNKQIYFKVNSSTYYFNSQYNWTTTKTSLGSSFNDALSHIENNYTHSEKKNIETEKIYKDTTTECIAKVNASFKDGSGTVVQKLYSNDIEIENTTTYYDASGNGSATKFTFTDISQFNNALSVISAKNGNRPFEKSAEEYKASASYINGSYGTNSFDFYSESGTLIYQSKFDELARFRDEQLSIYDKFEYVYDDSVDYCYDITRFLGRIECIDRASHDESDKIVFYDDIGTVIIEFPYDDNGKYKDAKKKIAETDYHEYYTHYDDNCSIIMLDESTPITIDESKKTIYYQKTIGFFIFKSTKTYYYKGGTDWSTNEFTISNDQWENAKKELSDFYSKTVTVNKNNFTITFKSGSTTYYYKGSNKNWQSSPKTFNNQDSLVNAKNALISAYGNAYSPYRDYYLYKNPFYSAHIKFSVDKTGSKPMYYITLLDGVGYETEIFKEKYDNADDFNNIRDVYESTFVENNNEYICTVGNYTVRIHASFKTLLFTADITSNKSNKVIYHLNYEKG